MTLNDLINKNLVTPNKITLVTFKNKASLTYFISTFIPEDSVKLSNCYWEYKSTNGAKVLLRVVSNKEDSHRCAGYEVHSLVMIGDKDIYTKRYLMARVRATGLGHSIYEGTVDKLVEYS